MSDFLITCKVLPIDMALQPKNFRMTYFLSRYPAVSHTFFLKEILGLRQKGFETDVASVNPPDRLKSSLLPREAGAGE